MKKVLLLIIVATFQIVAFSSCDESVYKGRKVYKAYFDYTLKDPESFKVYNEKYTKDGDFTVNWELDYGAKNSMGGMVRENVSFTTVGTSIFINGDYYKIEEFQGKIGFISAMTHKFCDQCNRVRMTAEGFLKACLQYQTGTDLKVVRLKS